MGKIANFVYTKSRLIIILVVLINVISLASFFRFDLDTDFLSFFSGGNPSADEYHRLNEKYHSGEAISVFIEQDSSLLNKDNLINVFQLQEEIKRLDGVVQVQSFIPPEIMVMGNVIPVTGELIRSQSQPLSEFIDSKYFLADQFLAADSSKGMLMVNLQTDAAAGEVVKSLQEIAEREDRLNISLAGNEIIKDTLWHYLLRILFILPPCAIILILLVFFTILRNRRLTILAIIPAGLAALWTFGTIFWSGLELNLVTVLSPLFILVIGSAYGLHYVTHFQENLPRYSDRRQLTVATLQMVGTPILLATVTTMAGFASLTWAKVIPMRQMGIFVTLGIGYAGLLSLLFVPAVLSRMKLPPKSPPLRESRLVRVILTVSRQKAPIIAVFLVILAVSAFYIPRLDVVSNQLMFFKPGSEIRQTFARVEEHFGSALPLTGEIISDKGSAAIYDSQFASKVLATERRLEELPGIKSAFSIFDLVMGINKMTAEENTYPQDPAVARGTLQQLGDEGQKSWISADGLKMIIKTEGLSSGDIARLEDFVAEQSEIRVITGMPLLFDEMNRLVVQSQIQSLGLALALIFIILLVTIRKFRAALVALIPIVITIIAILGMLSVSKFNLNILTANLSAISVGVGVDYSIHLISGIHYFRKQGMNGRDSVNSALSSVSRPVLTNAFGLAIGLSVLFFSPLQIHLQAASVMWVAMVVSSMAALLLIPIMYPGRSGKPAR